MKTNETPKRHPSSTWAVAGLLAALPLLGCDDTMQALGSETREEASEAKTEVRESAREASESAQAARVDLDRQAQEAKAELKDAAADVGQTAGKMEERLDRAVREGEEEIQQAAQRAQARIDAIDAEVAERIEDDG